MPGPDSQTLLREPDKKLLTATDKKRAQASCLFLPKQKATGKLPALPYKITSIGKLIDDALEVVEKENPKRRNVLVASVYDRRTFKSRIDRRQLHALQPNRRRSKPRKTSDDRRSMLQLQSDPAMGSGDLVVSARPTGVFFEKPCRATLAV